MLKNYTSYIIFYYELTNMRNFCFDLLSSPNKHWVIVYNWLYQISALDFSVSPSCETWNFWIIHFNLGDNSIHTLLIENSYLIMLVFNSSIGLIFVNVLVHTCGDTSPHCDWTNKVFAHNKDWKSLLLVSDLWVSWPLYKMILEKRFENNLQLNLRSLLRK